jgi:antitoxin component of MazEF toxin-antitoxin module
MARDIVKVRKVGETLVVTLTQVVLGAVDLKEGDRVLMETIAPRRIIISKEEQEVSNTRRVELELELLEKKRAAIETEMEYVSTQHNLKMPKQEGMEDKRVFELTIKGLALERDKLTVELSKKRLELFDLQGA